MTGSRFRLRGIIPFSRAEEARKTESDCEIPHNRRIPHVGGNWRVSQLRKGCAAGRRQWSIGGVGNGSDAGVADTVPVVGKTGPNRNGLEVILGSCGHPPLLRRGYEGQACAPTTFSTAPPSHRFSASAARVWMSRAWPALTTQREFGQMGRAAGRARSLSCRRLAERGTPWLPVRGRRSGRTLPARPRSINRCLLPQRRQTQRSGK